MVMIMIMMMVVAGVSTEHSEGHPQTNLEQSTFHWWSRGYDRRQHSHCYH